METREILFLNFTTDTYIQQMFWGEEDVLKLCAEDRLSTQQAEYVLKRYREEVNRIERRLEDNPYSIQKDEQ